MNDRLLAKVTNHDVDLHPDHRLSPHPGHGTDSEDRSRSSYDLGFNSGFILSLDPHPRTSLDSGHRMNPLHNSRVIAVLPSTLAPDLALGLISNACPTMNSVSTSRMNFDLGSSLCPGDGLNPTWFPAYLCLWTHVRVDHTGSEWLFPNRMCLLHCSPRFGGSRSSEETGANGSCRTMQPVKLPNNDELFLPIPVKLRWRAFQGEGALRTLQGFGT